MRVVAVMMHDMAVTMKDIIMEHKMCCSCRWRQKEWDNNLFAPRFGRGNLWLEKPWLFTERSQDSFVAPAEGKQGYQKFKTRAKILCHRQIRGARAGCCTVISVSRTHVRLVPLGSLLWTDSINQSIVSCREVFSLLLALRYIVATRKVRASSRGFTTVAVNSMKVILVVPWYIIL